MSKKEQPIIGFKGFDKHFKCREKQYAENETFEELATPELCKAGMHYCETPLDVFTYYAPDGKNQYAQIEDIGDKSVKKEDGEKSATNKLNIKTKISIGGLFKAHFELILKKVKVSDETVNTSGYEAHANTAGYEAHANTAGYGAHANTSGYEAHANTAGYGAHANTSGNGAHANTAGNGAHANTSGYEAHANTAGNGAHANTSGYEAHANTAGNEAIASSLGIRSKSMAVNGWIIIVDWRQDEKYNWHIHEIYRAKVGKHKIKGVLILSGTWYWFENGELKSEK